MPLNILVADDSVTMRRILELTFAGEDATVTAVDSGDAAIAKASEIRPDVVLADASMATDGYAVASAIKSTPGLENTAIVVLASQKTPYDEGKGSQSGVDDHVIKPFDTQAVIDKVKQVMGSPRAAAAARPAPPAARPAPPAPPAAPKGAPRSGTIAFGAPAPTAPGAPAAQAAPPAAPPRPAPAPAPAPMPAPAAAAAPVAAAVSAGAADLAGKLDGLGLTPDQVQGVLALSRDVIERVVWEVVPDLAETIIKEEIQRLTS
ncbi:MAG: response regulator [Myxococcales bacterium]|nr:response regulator [Myxococcales bacterium]